MPRYYDHLKSTKYLLDQDRLNANAEDLLENNKDTVRTLDNILREYKKDKTRPELHKEIKQLITELTQTIHKADVTDPSNFIEVTWRKWNQTAKRDNLIHVAVDKDAEYTLCKQSLIHPDITKRGLIKKKEGFDKDADQCTTCLQRSDLKFLPEPEPEIEAEDETNWGPPCGPTLEELIVASLD